MNFKNIIVIAIIAIDEGMKKRRAAAGIVLAFNAPGPCDFDALDGGVFGNIWLHR